MIKRLFTTYLPAVVVLTTATTAAVFLYQTNDPALANVEFITAESHQRIAENTEEAIESTEGEIENTEEEITKPSVETRFIASPTNSNAEPVDQPMVSAEPSTDTITVTISGPGVSQRCVVEEMAGSTVHQVMKQAAEQCGISYQWKNYPSLGVFVDVLAGVTSNKSNGKYWIYYVNGTKANVGVSSYTVVSGDELLWKFEQEY